MYLLSCPNCQAELSVTPAQAGDCIRCQKCNGEVAIPKLGELRALPQIDDGPTDAEIQSQPLGGTVAFVALGLIAVASLLGAGYNAIRWAMVETTMTTELHLADVEETYAKSEPAVMILEFEDMEELSLDLITPYKYHVTVLEKKKWGWNATIAAAMALVCGIGAFVAGSVGRNP